jgi:hypothetical protein
MMAKKSLKLTLLFILLTATVTAKTFHLNSREATKPFGLRIYCTTEGKGAFVQYDGQQGFMPLRLKKFTVSKLTNSNKQPEGYYYEWDELVEGKVTGSYGIVEHSASVSEAWYVRKRDGKHFNLVTAGKDALSENVQKYLLHGVLITFTSVCTDAQFMLTYPDGKVSTPGIISLDAADITRSSYIRDFNFDGYDDLAFSLPDAGMGVYQIFNIWLYNPVTRRFQLLEESQDARAKCSCLCEVKLNPEQKLLYTSCRGGARWWQDCYRIKENKLIWLRSGEKK